MYNHLLISPTYYIVSHGIYSLQQTSTVAYNRVQVGKLVKYKAHLF